MKAAPARLALTEPKHEQLLTVQEFAAMVRVHPKSIYRRIAEGRQPGVIEVGREYRINVAVALAPKKSDQSVDTR